MNISKATRTALIPIKREIKSLSTEYAYLLEKQGNIVAISKGSSSRVPVPFIKEARIFTHNHPIFEKAPSVLHGLTPNDIGIGVERGFSEVSAVTPNGFCYLVEIPKLGAYTVFGK